VLRLDCPISPSRKPYPIQHPNIRPSPYPISRPLQCAGSPAYCGGRGTGSDQVRTYGLTGYACFPHLYPDNGVPSNRRRSVSVTRPRTHGETKPSPRLSGQSTSSTKIIMPPRRRTSRPTSKRSLRPSHLCSSLPRESEKAFLERLQDSLSEGTTWSRIAALIELENSQSKTIARSGTGTSDLTRYKEILLRLKREGENAPGAAGY
jgi:hypothetical protein